MLSSSEEAIIEHALQVLALLVSLGRGGEIPPSAVLEAGIRAMSELKSMSGRYGETLE